MIELLGMKWIIHFDIVAFALIAVILIVYCTYSHLNTFQSKTYRNLLIISLLSTITDIASAWAGSFLGVNDIALNVIIHLVHFMVQNLVPCIYSLFAYSLVFDTGKIGRTWFSLIFVPYIFNFSLIVTTPITGACFYFDELGNYHRGSGQFFTYAIAIYYIVLSCYIVIKNMRVLNRPQRLCVFLYSFECIALNLVQIFHGQYLLQEIGIAFAMFFIYITMQNPLEYTDVTTGTYNRNLFKKTINGKIAKNESAAIVCVQVDGLSYISKKFGIQNDSVLLKSVAEFLLDFGKEISVYRLTNRQFALVMAEKQDYKGYAEKIIRRFERTFALDNINVSVNLVAHVCCIQSIRDLHSINDVLDIIDYSLNEAKKNTKNEVIFATSEIFEKHRREVEITQAISHAVSKKTFQVYYQPIYSEKEGKYTSAEALVRLIDPNLGMISPDTFIPIAEKNGSILTIGEIVLEKVCTFVEQFHPEDFGIKSIHVNLSVIQCMQDDIAFKLTSIINNHRIAPGLIDFEITETTADNTNKLEKIMSEFNTKGINFSLDDYGTGYSNQANLMKYPYSIVKIDKSMIWACDTNPKALISLKHTVAMIKDLEMSVLAEGVETEEQKAMLCELGCDYFQGYYYSKPVPQDDFLTIIRNGKISGAVTSL